MAGAELAARSPVSLLDQVRALSHALNGVTLEADAAAVVCSALRATLGASAGLLLEPGPSGLRVLAQEGYSGAMAAFLQGVLPGGPATAAADDVARSGTPVLMSSRADLERRYPSWAPRAENRSWALVPGTCGQTRVVASIAFADERAFTPEDQTFLEAVLALAAQAIDRGRAFQAERRARLDAQRREGWARIQAEAGNLFARTADEGVVIDAIVRLPVPSIASWTFLDLLRNGALERVAIAHQDPELEGIAWDSARRDGVSLAVRNILEGGAPHFVPTVSDEAVDTGAADARHAVAIRRLGLKSAISIPLSSQGERFGVVSFVRADPPFSLEDFEEAQAYGATAAFAIAATRRLRERQLSAETNKEALRTLAHDVKTPLAAAMMRLETLRSEADPAKVEAMAANLGRINSITDAVLQSARAEGGVLELWAQPMQLDAVALRALETVSPLAQARGIKLSADVRPAPCMGDPARLEQCLENILGNSLKFTPKGGTIHLRSGATPDGAFVEVSDTGIGWRSQDHDLLFRPFSRPNRVGSGTGLGLYLARQVVSRLGGSIAATSAGPGQGSLVRMALPPVPSYDKAKAD